MSKKRWIGNVAVGCALTAGLVLAPIAATGGLSAPAGASGSTGVLGHTGLVPASPAAPASAASAPGTYQMTLSLNTIPVVTYSAPLSIAANGSFTWKPNNLACDGVWTATGNYLALEVSGSTAVGCIVGADWVLAGHLTRKGVRGGTTMLWKIDAAGNPTSFLANGTWSAVRG